MPRRRYVAITCRRYDGARCYSYAQRYAMPALLKRDALIADGSAACLRLLFADAAFFFRHVFFSDVTPPLLFLRVTR